MSPFADQLAENLLQINAIKLNPQNPFTWASGLKSPIYCDNRIALSDPATRKIICDAFSMMVMRYNPFNNIAGVATAGIPHGAILAHRLDKPFCYVRSKPKAHGRKNQIEGLLKQGDRVVMVEDLISTGGSALKAVDAVEEAGAEVKAVIAIFSYGFDLAKNAFEKKGIPYDTILDYDRLISRALENNYISMADQETLLAWREDPQNWLS